MTLNLNWEQASRLEKDRQEWRKLVGRTDADDDDERKVHLSTRLSWTKIGINCKSRLMLDLLIVAAL